MKYYIRAHLRCITLTCHIFLTIISLKTVVWKLTSDNKNNLKTSRCPVITTCFFFSNPTKDKSFLLLLFILHPQMLLLYGLTNLQLAVKTQLLQRNNLLVAIIHNKLCFNVNYVLVSFSIALSLSFSPCLSLHYFQSVRRFISLTSFSNWSPKSISAKI